MDKHVFCMDRDFMAQLCLYELHHILLTWHNPDIQIEAWLEPPNYLIHYGESCVFLYNTGITGGNAYSFDRNTVGKTCKINWLFQSNVILSILNLILSILETLQGLGSMHFAPGFQLQRQLSYTKCLVPDRVLKKRKLDSNARYGPENLYGMKYCKARSPLGDWISEVYSW